MRFIGNKTRLLTYMHEILRKNDALPGNRFFDFFAGTGSVGKYFKEQGFTVYSSDILYFSYVLQRAYIAFTGEPAFKRLLPTVSKMPRQRLMSSPYELVLEYLNALPGVRGFIYKNYTEEGTKGSTYVRKFFKGENGKKIDAIRRKLTYWKKHRKITEAEYFILLATLIESVPFYANISGVYAAFLKTYDPRAKKDLVLRPIQLSRKGPLGKVYNRNSMDLLGKVDTDILYVDPPYNARQYAPNYHLLETIAKYDRPKIKGVAGIRPYLDQKSEFCNRDTALVALDTIARSPGYKVLALSYNTEGIMPQKSIMAVLSKYGDVTVHEVDYRRFKSNSNGSAKHTPFVKEQLFILKRS